MASATRGTDATEDRRARLVDSNVLILDDCRLLRDLLAECLGPFTREVCIAWDKESLAAQRHRAEPDVILANMSGRDASIILQEGLDRTSAAKVIAYGLAEDDENTIISCIEAGVAGFHLRSESMTDLRVFMERVLAGESVCSQRFSTILLRKLSDLSAKRPGVGDTALTPREDEILEMIAKGLPNREIAKRLGIAVHTVKNHVHNLLAKIGARSRAEAAASYRRDALE